ncbi:Smr/MutS family protein [Pontixanthobacter aquaemixtae]|uniref:DNA mismatch repair protein MutS n=1 Tax=Pontixanthobacter aquaemixtae TaxID=1958940 RepID=A0A844ZX65_9SPHN|nr:Smr/MutS family protein [Pontixanthobacter aquaemixtae]MXO91760.1 DNA mismatch repair protein MutS [Pontixanthobacter aquaemixtae]
MKLPRGLTAEEEAAWAKLASSVEPMEGRVVPKASRIVTGSAALKKGSGPGSQRKPTPPSPPTRPLSQRKGSIPPPRQFAHRSLDSHWDKKLKSGAIAPDYTLDLHDHFVDAAYERLDRGMRQARAMDARLVLVITGRPRPVEAADRGSKRGVIRAKMLDWLAASDHADAIAAIRKAHRKHGGEGALYVVLRRAR